MHNFKFSTLFLGFNSDKPTLHVSHRIKDDISEIIGYFGSREQPGDTLIDLEYFLLNCPDAEYYLRHPDASVPAVNHETILKNLRNNDSVFLLRLGQFLSIKTRFGYATIWSLERNGQAYISWRLTTYQYPNKKLCRQLWDSHMNKRSKIHHRQRVS